MKVPELPKIEDEVKVITLVCYLLEYLGALTETQLTEIVTLDNIVSPFKLTDALTTIEKREIAVLHETKKNYTLTEAGKIWLREFENSLAITLRRKMLAEGKNVVRMSALKKSVKWGVAESKGVWVFTASFLNEIDGNPIMEVRLFSRSEESALALQEKFLRNPTKALGDSIANFI
jgi:DNA-binding PadR family transcriptional regulator